MKASKRHYETRRPGFLQMVQGSITPDPLLPSVCAVYEAALHEGGNEVDDSAEDSPSMPSRRSIVVSRTRCKGPAVLSQKESTAFRAPAATFFFVCRVFSNQGFIVFPPYSGGNTMKSTASSVLGFKLFQHVVGACMYDTVRHVYVSQPGDCVAPRSGQRTPSSRQEVTVDQEPYQPRP